MRFAPILLCAAAVWAASLLDRSAGSWAGADGFAAHSGLHDTAEGNTEFVLAELRHKIHAFKKGVRAETARWAKLRRQIAELEQSILGGGSGEPVGASSTVVVTGGAVAGPVPRPLIRPAVAPGRSPAARAAPLPSLKPDHAIEPEAARIATATPAPANGDRRTAISSNSSAPAPPATNAVPPAPTREPHGSTGSGAAGRAPPAPAGEGRFELTAAQMDAITAGLAGIDIDAMAVALGPGGYAATDVETHALSDEQGLYEVAYGTGQAQAAGKATGVHVATEIYGDGAVVVGTRFGYEYDLPSYSEGRTGGFVVSVDPAHPRLRAVVHRAGALAAGLQHAYRIAVARAERGDWLLQRNAEYGRRYLARHLQRDRDRLVRRFQFGMHRLLQTLETDQR